MRRLTTTVFAVCTFALAIPPTTHAQSSAGEFSAGWRILRVEETIPNRITGTFPTPSLFTAGWYLDVPANITDVIGIVGDVAGHYGTIDDTERLVSIQIDHDRYLRVHTALGGVRFSARQNPRFVPFGQALIGFSNASTKFDQTTTISGQTISTREETESNTDLAVELGGGLNIRLTEAVGVRLGAGYFRVRKETPESIGPASHLEGVRNWGIRLAAGVVLPF